MSIHVASTWIMSFSVHYKLCSEHNCLNQELEEKNSTVIQLKCQIWYRIKILSGFFFVCLFLCLFVCVLVSN